ncbi:MAG: hypothetical protein SF123_06675 [Chloroflexota bacterium]|nr:hypothetical protein [Chloroflexota bacterium]
MRIRLIVLLMLVLSVFAAPSLAHEGREVGEYELFSAGATSLPTLVCSTVPK